MKELTYGQLLEKFKEKFPSKEIIDYRYGDGKSINIQLDDNVLINARYVEEDDDFIIGTSDYLEDDKKVSEQQEKELQAKVLERAKNKYKHNHSDSPFVKAGIKIGELVSEKNIAYGNSFNKCNEFLKILYPDGVKPDQYKDMLALVRIFDKMMRIANKKDAFGESPYSDIAGYSILKVVDEIESAENS